jgi:hypothetical protein
METINKINKKSVVKCRGLYKNGNQCKVNVTDVGCFCKSHAYMSSYTEDMIKNMKSCRWCGKYYYFPNIKRLCDKCAEKIHLCKDSECIVEVFPHGEYCFEHRKIELKKQGLKYCGDGKYKCRNIVKIGCRAYDICERCERINMMT